MHNKVINKFKIIETLEKFEEMACKKSDTMWV